MSEARREEALVEPTPVEEAPQQIASEPWQIRLGFLSADITRLQRLLLQRTAERIGGTHVQWRLLRELTLRQGITQGELGDILDVNKATMCGLVDRVVKAGLVERRNDSRDHRVKRLYLTKRARQAMANMRAEVDLLTAETMSNIPDGVGETVVACLEEIKSNLLEMKGDPPRKKATRRPL